MAKPAGGQDISAESWLTALEASLLVLAAYFLAVAALVMLSPDERDLTGWLLRSSVPLLIMLIGALLVRRRSADLYELGHTRGWLGLASIGALLLGATGGISIGPTLPTSLAPLLPEASAAAWGVIWVGVAAPIIEELFFRGTLQPAIERRLGGGLAILLAGTAFTIAHLGGMPITVVPVIGLLGIAAGFAAHLTQSVLPAITVHIGWNLGTVGISFADYTRVQSWHIMLSACAGTLCVASAFWLRRKGAVR